MAENGILKWRRILVRILSYFFFFFGRFFVTILEILVTSLECVNIAFCNMKLTIVVGIMDSI